MHCIFFKVDDAKFRFKQVAHEHTGRNDNPLRQCVRLPIGRASCSTMSAKEWKRTSMGALRSVARTCSSLSWNRSRRLKDRPAGRGNVRGRGMLIEHRLRARIGPGCAGGQSRHGLHPTAHSDAKGQADGVGLLNRPSDGCSVFSGCASAMNGGPVFTRPFLR